MKYTIKDTKHNVVFETDDLAEARTAIEGTNHLIHYSKEVCKELQESREEDKKVYEIYTINPETKEAGWDLLFVRTNKDIKTFPNFDCIITVNDFPMNGDVDSIIEF